MRRQRGMRRRFAHWFAAGVALLLFVSTMLAHHEIAAKFDPSKARTLSGVVTRVDWANPHVHVLINVREGAQLVNWAVELESQRNWNEARGSGIRSNPETPSPYRDLWHATEVIRSGGTPSFSRRPVDKYWP